MDLSTVRAALTESAARLRQERPDAYLDINELKRTVREAGGDDSVVDELARLDGASGVTVAEALRFIDGYIESEGDAQRLAAELSGTVLAGGMANAGGLAAALRAPQATYRVNARLPPGSHEVQTFGSPKFDLLPESASRDQLLAALRRRRPDIARTSDNTPMVSKGEMAWLQHLATHPAADRTVRLEIVALLGDLPATTSAKSAGSEAFRKTLIKHADSKTLPFDHWAFGPGPAVPPDATTEDLQTRLASGWHGNEGTGHAGVGEYLTRSEMAWLEALAAHPAATQELKNQILTKVSQVELGLSAVRAGALPFLTSLLPDEGATQRSRYFGVADPALGFVHPQASGTTLSSLFDSAWPRIAEGGALSRAEVAWLQILCDHPNASYQLRQEVSRRTADMELGDDTAGARYYLRTLLLPVLGAPARAFPGLTAEQAQAQLDAMRTATRDELEAMLDDNLGMIRRGGYLNPNEAAWLAELAASPHADLGLRARIRHEASRLRLTTKAEEAGVPAFIAALPERNVARWDFGEVRDKMPGVASTASRTELRTALDQGWGRIAAGGWLSPPELAWLLAITSHPNADDALRAEIRARASALRLSGAAVEADAKSYLDSLPAPDPTDLLFDFGRPATDLPEIPANESTQHLLSLLDDTVLWKRISDRRQISRGEAAWLYALSSHPAATDDLRRRLLDKIAGLRPTAAAMRGGFDVYIESIQPRGEPPPVEVAALVDALRRTREQLRQAAGGDRALTAGEVAAAIPKLTETEARALNKLYDEIRDLAGGVEAIPVDRIVALTNDAIVAIGRADQDGDGIGREEMVRVGALGAAVIELGRWLGGEKAPVLPVFETTDFLDRDGEPLRDADLLEAIRQQAGKHLELSYKRARMAMFRDIDNDNGTVRGVYTGLEVRTNDIPPASGSNGMNTEHTWPKSRGVKNTPAESDIHHLFPTESFTNSKRASYPFGEVVRVSWSRNEAKLGQDDLGRIVFQPPPEHRGNVARALFFISAVYGLPIESAEEKVLRRWHKEDPVDADERQRNNEISQYQGNRNPIIDLVEIVDRIGDF